MKILAGTQRKRKTPASFTVTPAETDAGPQETAASPAAAAPAKSALFVKIIWGMLLLSLAESMVLAGMVYRMPMQQFVDQTEAPPDPEQAQVILADQANLLGLRDKSSPAVAVVPSNDIGPIHYPAVTRLADADIPGLPANLAKQQQQAATANASQATPDLAPVAPPKEEHPALPAPDQIPRAKMPVLDFHSVLEQVLPRETKPPAAPAHTPDKPVQASPAPADRPRTAMPAQAGAKTALPEHPVAAPALLPAPIELYRPKGAPAPDALPPVGGMRITPHPAPALRPAAPSSHNGATAVTAPDKMDASSSTKAHAPSDVAAPTTAAAQPPANQEQADAAARHTAQALHRPHPTDDQPLPPEATAPRRHLPQSPTHEPALVDRPPLVVPPPERLGPPHIIVPVRPILPRRPITLDRPPGVQPGRPMDRPPPGARLLPPPGAHLMPPPGAHLVPPPGARLGPRVPDMDAPVEDRPPPPRDRPAQDGPDTMPPPTDDLAP